MTINITEAEKYVLVALENERLDAVYAPEFRKKMQEIIAGKHPFIVLDLSRVNFIDSSGLGAIVAALKSVKAEGELVLCGARQPVMRLFKLTHMDKVFTLYPDVDSGVQALSR